MGYFDIEYRIKRRDTGLAQVEDLLNRLKDAQRGLILQAAESPNGPAHSVVERIGELELAIGAVEQFLDDDES